MIIVTNATKNCYDSIFCFSIDLETVKYFDMISNPFDPKCLWIKTKSKIYLGRLETQFNNITL